MYLLAILPFVILDTTSSANWAQLAGDIAQNNAIPCTPDKIYFNASEATCGMWTARWGHTVVVVNQTTPRNDFTDEENADLSHSGKPILVLLGGDDYVTGGYRSLVEAGGGQLRNDVWWTSLLTGTEKRWMLSKTGKSIGDPKIESQMKWTQSNRGKVAPETWPNDWNRRVTYMEWIQCQEVFLETQGNDTTCAEPADNCFENIRNSGCKPEAVWKRDNMWSPRRGHGSVVVNGKLFVIGGRSREIIDTRHSTWTGGIIDGKNEVNSNKGYHHKESVLKNDIWVSDDGLGETWWLLNPGCQDHQEDILLQTEVWRNNPKNKRRKRNLGSVCETSDDCFGRAICQHLDISLHKTCVCPMFSPREHHAVVVQHRYNPDKGYKEDYIYVIGGFTNIKKSFCGDRICEGRPSYRHALNDVWVSNDGLNWIQLAPVKSQDGYFPPRGAHASLISYNKSAQTDQLCFFGGAASDSENESTAYLSDVWCVDMSTSPCCMIHDECQYIYKTLKVDDIGKCLPDKSAFHEVIINASWSARAGHAVVYEPALSRNSFQHQMYLIGGRNETHSFSDVWSWDFNSDEPWRKDFHGDQWYRSIKNGILHFGPSNSDDPSSESNSPHKMYLTGESLVSELAVTFLPNQSQTKDLENFTRTDRVPLLKGSDVAILIDNNVRTISDLASIDLYSLLKLRGFDFPGKPVSPISHICEALFIARDFLNKCVVGKAWNETNKERRISKLYRNNSNPVEMVFGEEYHAETIEKCSETTCASTTWDGCSPLGNEIMVDVIGIGNVPVPREIFDPTFYTQDIHCRTIPKARYFAAAELLDNQIILLGGRGLEANELFRDTWTRDDTFPQASIARRPRDGTKDSVFFFESNEESAQVFEYKIMDETERLPVTAWIKAMVDEKIDVSWLDNKQGGPGRGRYALFVRAIDSSGNIDYRFTKKSNVHVWTYIPPLPWTKIISSTASGLLLIILIHFEYRRRKRKAALERYAIRRMRRKFKARAISNGLGNITDEEWRAIYLHSKAVQQKKKEKVSANDQNHTSNQNISINNSHVTLNNTSTILSQQVKTDKDTSLSHVIFEKHGEDVVVDESYREIHNAIGESIDLLLSDQRFMQRTPFILGICRDTVKISSNLNRVGRFEKVLHVLAPSQEQRKAIFKFLLQRLPLNVGNNTDVTQLVDDLVLRTSGFTPSDIHEIFNKAHLAAASRLSNISKNFSISSASLENVDLDWNDIELGIKDIIPAQLELLDVIPPQFGINDKWSNFAGYVDVKKRLYRTVIKPWERRNNPNRKPNYLMISPPSGVVFHGPSGTGKTEAALCLAAALGVCVIHIKASDVLDKWLGGSEATIRKIFARARAASPCVILFDEIDAIASNREDNIGTDVHSRILSTLLNEMDGISKNSSKQDILVIGATNRLYAIDAALLRPGRLQEHIFLPLPSQQDCLAILNLYTQKMPLDDSVSFISLIDYFIKHRMNGSNIKNICRDACLNAMRKANRKQNPSVTMNDFLEAMNLHF